MSTNQEQSKQYNEDIFQFAGNTLFSGTGLIFFFVIIVAVAILFTNLGDTANESMTFYQPTDETKTNNLFIILFVGIILIIALMGGIRYFFGTDVYATISGLFGPEPEIDVVIDHKTIRNDEDEEPTVPPSEYDIPNDTPVQPSDPAEPASTKKQVFNIPGNYYRYNAAKNLCAAYDARLATYEEVEDSYENGGEWCNYGWSAGQMALFPTQQKTYLELQGIDGHEHDCGRPGVNGGYIENPNVKFGVNCYGIKPKIDDDEKFLMENQTLYPKSKKDIAREKEIERMKKNLGNILVSPFNSNEWSRY